MEILINHGAPGTKPKVFVDSLEITSILHGIVDHGRGPKQKFELCLLPKNQLMAMKDNPQERAKMEAVNRLMKSPGHSTHVELWYFVAEGAAWERCQNEAIEFE